MSLDRLLHELTIHYRTRGFPTSALLNLRLTLLSSLDTTTNSFSLDTAYPSCDARIGDLLGCFQPVDGSNPRITKVTPCAVFGFSFGYRMASWVDGTHPTDELEVRLRRRPGKNNTELAKIAESIQTTQGLPLYLQFEIADAVSSNIPIVCASDRKDLVTIEVAATFLDHARNTISSVDTVVLLAHQHHFERCRIILERMGVACVSPNQTYNQYDEYEAQPRVMSPEEYIVNDFFSMARMFSTK